VEESGWELQEAVHEGHMPFLESISPVGIAGSRRDSPKTGVSGHHALEREKNSLARACHTPMRGRRMKTWRPSEEVEDAGEKQEKIIEDPVD
jgi:hypothetical protein